MKLFLKTTCCICCVEVEENQAVMADVWNDGKDSYYCSGDCLSYAEDQRQEYLDSYED